MNCFKMMIGSFLVISSVVIAMEGNKKQESLQKNDSSPIAIVQKSSSIPLLQKSSPDTSGYTLSLPTLTSLSNNLNSLRNTVNNYVWDDSAFKKIGWPLSDEFAQQQLIETQNVYTRMNNHLKTGIMYDEFKNDSDAISRRNGYLQRVLYALENHPQGVELALFCLEHHEQVMNTFDKTRFLLFVEGKKATITQETRRVYADLLKVTIVPENIPLLSNLKHIASGTEKERLEKEQLEKERIEKELLEKERLEKERLEQEQLEKEKLEKERLEQEQREKEEAGKQ